MAPCQVNGFVFRRFSVERIAAFSVVENERMTKLLQALDVLFYDTNVRAHHTNLSLNHRLVQQKIAQKSIEDFDPDV